jgi:hypothetical protein
VRGFATARSFDLVQEEMMPRPRKNEAARKVPGEATRTATRTARVETLLPMYHEAVKGNRTDEIELLHAHVADVCGMAHVVPVLMSLLGRLYAEKGTYKAAVEEKQQLIDSLLTAPRRVTRLLGRIEPSHDDQTDARGHGQTDAGWAIVEGPPHQAVRFGADVDPDVVCAGWPDEPVWVWVVESMGVASVAGRIDPPLPLNAGLERIMVFEGLVEGGDDDGH